MGLGDILDEAFDLYKNNFSLLAGIGALVFFPMNFISGMNTNNDIFGFLSRSSAATSVSMSPAMGGETYGILILLTVLAYPIALCTFAYAISQRYMDTAIGIGSAYKYALRRAGAIIWTVILFGAAYIGISIAAGIGFFVVGALSLGSPIITVPLIVAVVLLMVYVICRLAFTFVALVVDGKSGFAAMSRSWNLSAQHGWRVTGILLLSSILVYIIVAVFTVGVSLLTRVVTTDQSALMLINGTLNGIVGVLMAPILTIIVVLLYYDLRIRKEGFDLQMLAQDLARVGIGKAGYPQEKAPVYQNQYQPTVQPKQNPYGPLTVPEQAQQSQPICSYCRYPIRAPEDGVMCPSCRALLHRSCWNERGGCTTSGCPAAPKQGSSGQ